jgi:hypothetical protein
MFTWLEIVWWSKKNHRRDVDVQWSWIVAAVVVWGSMAVFMWRQAARRVCQLRLWLAGFNDLAYDELNTKVLHLPRWQGCRRPRTFLPLLDASLRSSFTYIRYELTHNIFESIANWYYLCSQFLCTTVSALECAHHQILSCVRNCLGVW